MATFGIFGAGRLIITLAVLWLIFIFFLGGSIFHRNESDASSIDTSEMIHARLNRASSELRTLRLQNAKLKKLIDDLIPRTVSSDDIASNPSSSAVYSQRAYEKSLRKLHNDIDEMWYAFESGKFSDKNLISELRHSMKYDLSIISSRDKMWRNQGLKKLGDLVRSKIENLQNPSDCSNAPKVVCNLNKGCGFGCQLHHVTYCLVVALGLNRTMILNSHNWRYVKTTAKKSGWNFVFQPLSSNCVQLDAKSSSKPWNGDTKSKEKVLTLPIIDILVRSRPDFLPLAIPSQIAEQVDLFSPCPSAWFLGQLVSYLMRLSPDMEQFIDDAKYRYNFKSPIVGIHVRRTDKVGTEASFHPLSEYMKHVDQFYDRLHLDAQRRGEKGFNVERSVYLATDDPGIWTKEVPEYEEKGYYFLGDADVANSAGVGTRYELDSLKNVIMDIWLLSLTDHIVCTFSSQVCRIAYELMQSRSTNNYTQDWCTAFNSLDDIYYYGGQRPHDMIAILNNQGDNGHISFSVGDVIGIAGNHWNGESKGENRRTRQTGLFPSFKVVDKIHKARFQAFDD